jgi:hypothetical protein
LFRKVRRPFASIAVSFIYQGSSLIGSGGVLFGLAARETPGRDWAKNTQRRNPAPRLERCMELRETAKSRAA